MVFGNNVGGNYDRFKSHSSYKDGSMGNKYTRQRKKKKDESASSAFDEDDDNSIKYDDEDVSLDTIFGVDYDKNDDNIEYETQNTYNDTPSLANNDDDYPKTNFFETGL